ncbi:MAG: cobyrinate a,c-diamide synthase [Alphaproteobacteria bacterium]|nr:MAG: cobyrinate a,c-diamide synthase [Alphaproteobacteria bacterium]
MAGRGLVIAAPASGSGKTVLTLGLLRALRERGLGVVAGKSGPDYIDPAFHAAATGAEAANYDAWAMPPARLRAQARAAPGRLLVIEGAMGLFDGAPPDGAGSSADLAAALGLPVILIVDAARQGASVAALAEGFIGHRSDVRVAGLILNRVGSPRHERMLRRALSGLAVPVLGAVGREDALALPSRHLGLVQAGEHPGLEAFLAGAACIVSGCVDLERLAGLAAPITDTGERYRRLDPPGQRVAVAQDAAFGFSYAHMLGDWRASGAEILPFSPLADQAPDPSADAVVLPGGYPELHAGPIAAAERFRAGMQAAAARGALIQGECGGYMVLGRGLIDAEGQRHRMLGLLGLETSFAERRLHLGYRRIEALPGGPVTGRFRGHEFHYATTLRAEGEPAFRMRDAEGEDLGPAGLRHERIIGSFAHLIDRD